jgi:hypothetical protein
MGEKSGPLGTLRMTVLDIVIFSRSANRHRVLEPFASNCGSGGFHIRDEHASETRLVDTAQKAGWIARGIRIIGLLT